MNAAVLSSKYQIALPAETRGEARVKPGQKMGVIIKGGLITLVPLRPLEEMRGFVPRASSEGLREEEDEERI